MIKKVILTIILIFTALFNIAVVYIDNNLDTKNHQNTYNSEHKIWAARGLYKTRAEQNSITAINRAFDSGALGIEVDFSYDVEMDLFIVSHDHPILGADEKLIYTTKDGELLTLEKLFVKTGKAHYFWLDYKNLDKLSDAQTHKAITRLDEISKFDSIKERLYIEGSNPLKISLYTDAGFKTILGIHPLHESVIFSSVVVNAYKIAYFFRNITALAMPYGSVEDPIYGEQTQENLKTIPVFLFHIPDDEKLLHSLVQKDDVRVMLVGRDQSINRYYIKKEK